ncbi:MAG TPA: hypothetical protein VEX11_19865 [Acetobacteraceae bacterium]|nr:hypothetical protein [Acetobacteraceae bacterium]
MLRPGSVLGPAPSVGDALRLAEAAAADGGLSAAVLDINLEGQRVWPVADRLAALGVPFLFAAGYGENCDTSGHGAAPVLHKPFDVETLVAAVATLASVRGRRGVPVATVRSAAQAEAALTAWALPLGPAAGPCCRVGALTHEAMRALRWPATPKPLRSGVWFDPPADVRIEPLELRPQLAKRGSHAG